MIRAPIPPISKPPRPIPPAPDRPEHAFVCDIPPQHQRRDSTVAIRRLRADERIGPAFLRAQHEGGGVEGEDLPPLGGIVRRGGGEEGRACGPAAREEVGAHEEGGRVAGDGEAVPCVWVHGWGGHFCKQRPEICARWARRVREFF
jgi:hypothetical protein